MDKAMTNLITQVTLAFVLITNWTGVVFEKQELGYVATNHTLKVQYEGKAFEFQLKCVPSNKAVWREQQPITNHGVGSQRPEGAIHKILHRHPLITAHPKPPPQPSPDNPNPRPHGPGVGCRIQGFA